MKDLFLGILNRFKEPSSWAGISALLVGAGVHLDPLLLQPVTLALAGVAGVLAFVLREKTPPAA